MFTGRISDHEQPGLPDAAATSSFRVQPFRVGQVALQGGSWCIPRIAPSIPALLSTAGAMAPRHLAAFALAAHAHGVPLPSGKFTSPKDTILKQWKRYSNTLCGADDPLAMTMGVEATEDRITVQFSAQSVLTTVRLKPVIERLNKAVPGLGWWVFDVVDRAGNDDFPIYNMREIAGMCSHMWFYDCWSDEDVAEEIRNMDESLDGKSVDEIREQYDHPWPSDVLQSVDGNAWMVGAGTFKTGKWRSLGPAKPKMASLKDVKAFLGSRRSTELRAVVGDALILHAALEDKSSPLKEGLTPTAGDLGSYHHDDDERLMRIGATCFVVWDQPNYAWEAASHFESYEMQGGEATDIFYHLKADPTNPTELQKLVTNALEIVHRHSMVSKLLRHFPKE